MATIWDYGEVENDHVLSKLCITFSRSVWKEFLEIFSEIFKDCDVNSWLFYAKVDRGNYNINISSSQDEPNTCGTFHIYVQKSAEKIYIEYLHETIVENVFTIYRIAPDVTEFISALIYKLSEITPAE